MDGTSPGITGATGSARRRSLVLLLLLATCGALLLCDAPAWALLARGHVFAGTFEGTGAQSFTNPASVAVDEATGEVYVVDSGHERVERFKPVGESYEVVGEFDVPSAGAIAIDNSSGGSDPSRGDVYVAGAEEKEESPEERDFVYKFTASGEKIFRKSVFKVTENKEEFETELEDIAGLAVDAAGRLWVYWYEEGNISGFSDEEKNKLLPSLTKEEVLDQRLLEEGCLTEPGFAVGSDDEAFYVAHVRANPFGECPEEEPEPTVVSRLEGSGVAAARSLDNRDTTGVALDSANGDVYADNVGSVAAFGPEGAFIQRFGEGDLSDGGAIALDSARGKIYVAEPASHKIAVFGPEGAGPPTIDSVSAQNLTSSSERLSAQIDPDGAQTSYYAQYGTVSCVEHESSCTEKSAPPPEDDVGDGFADVAAHVTVEQLQPDTTYYYRIVARNEHGTVESPESTETFFTTLPTSEGLLADHREWEMVSSPEKHGAAAEPISREGALIQAAADGDAISWTASAPVTGEAEGNRRPEPVQVISTRGTEGWSSQDVTTPHNRGEGVEPGAATEYRFFSPDLSLAVVEPQIPNQPLENPPLAPEAKEKTIYRRSDASGEYEPLVTAANDETGTPFGGKLEFQGATSDLQHVVFESQVPLLSGAGESGLYEWESGSQLKLVSVLPGSEHTPASAPELGYNGRDVRGAMSQDGSRVFWTNEGELGPLYMHDTITGETVQVNAAQGVPEAGGEEIEDELDEVYFQAASSDGSRVFFTDIWPLTSESTLEPTENEEVSEKGRPADLYEFNTETGKLIDLTGDQNVDEYAEVLGTLPGISEDGSYVYFVANGVLAPGAERGDCPRINPLHIAQPEAACNLYVSEPDPAQPGQRETRLVARLSYEDAPDWGEGNSPLAGDLGGVTSQVSSNGRYLAFMSDRELTGYGNVDASPGAKGAHDEEVFVYDASSGRMVCASCNPSGQAPQGVFDTELAGEGDGLTVDRPETWSGHWLAGSVPGWTLFELNKPTAEHQSRYLSNDGRLFFDSADALVAQDQARTREESVNGTTLNVGVENVYEYEPDGLGSCQRAGGCVTLVSSGTSERESAFLDASESGDDVFFLTAAQLVAQDTDTSLDVYDARVCGTSEMQPCLPIQTPAPPPCAGEGECRPPAPPQSSPSAPASSMFSGPGNQANVGGGAPSTKPPPARKPLTRAQKLARALKACHKLKRRKPRRVCERKARRAYGAKTKPTRKPAKKSASSRKRTL